MIRPDILEMTSIKSPNVRAEPTRNMSIIDHVALAIFNIEGLMKCPPCFEGVVTRRENIFEMPKCISENYHDWEDYKIWNDKQVLELVQDAYQKAGWTLSLLEHNGEKFLRIEPIVE